MTIPSPTATWLGGAACSAFVLAAAFAGVTIAASAQPMQPGGVVEIRVSRTAPGAPPPDFEFWRTGRGEVGRWIVVEDPTAVGGKAIEQSSTDRTDYRFPLAIYKPVSAEDVEVETRFKPVSGRIDQAGGIALRLTTPDDYYVARANALEDNVNFYRVVKGKREQVAGANTKVSSGEWHTLRVRAQGDKFTVSFDEKELFTTTDDTFRGDGKVALWTKADSVTRFERVSIKPLQGTAR
jgi:hypothetical protein